MEEDEKKQDLEAKDMKRTRTRSKTTAEDKKNVEAPRCDEKCRRS